MGEDKKDVDKQIEKATHLSNALLSGLLASRVQENKKNIKVNVSLRSLLDAVQIYHTEISRLQWVAT